MPDQPEVVGLYYVRQAVNGCLDNGLSMELIDEIFSRELLNECLKRAGNNQLALSIAEGVHRNTIARRMKKLNIATPSSRKIRSS